MAVKTKDIDLGYRRILGELKKLEKDPYVKVGILSKGDAPGGQFDPWLGAVHEFGTKIKVTPKMRNYLAFMGLYLKRSTGVIRIPERSYIRHTHDTKNREWSILTAKLQDDIYKGRTNVSKALSKIGKRITKDIRTRILGVRTPRLHPFTIMQKGDDNPLVNTGRLERSIFFEKVMK